MKKSSFFISSMMALTCAFGLTACSSSEEEVIDNPNYDPLTKTVNANFVFSISTGNTSSATRQSSASTQATIQEKFRGISDAQVFAFSLSSNGRYVTTASTAAKSYDLGVILDPGKLDPDGSGLNADGDGVPLSHRVIELSLPTETNTLMFWGRSSKNGSSAEQGEIVFDASHSDISNHSFSLTPRIPKSSTSTTGQDAFAQYQSIITKALNTISQSEVTNKDISFGSETRNVSSLSWSDYVDLTVSPIDKRANDPSNPSSAMCPLGDILGHAFAIFHTINDGEIRGGSGLSVAQMLEELHEVIGSVADAVPTSLAEAIAQQVGVTVRNNIELFLDKNASAKWLPVDDVVSNAGLSTTAVNLVMADSHCDLNVFPCNFDVPSGVAQLAFTPSSCQWRYEETPHSLIGTGAPASVFDYMFPAELCYFGNSPIRVTDAPKTPSQYPDGVSNWVNDNSWSGWTKNASVQATTRSVAMQDNINYGTALLESTVRYGSSILEDNNHAIQKLKNPSLSDSDEPNNEIEVSASTFKLTGIIVGGQPQTVGWDYLAKEGRTASFNYLIYDNSLPDGTIPVYTASGNKSTPNYTLVWDNWSEAQRNQDQSAVYVALEFVNNSGKDFFGKENKVPNGGTFYIVGKLDPDKKPSTLKDITDAAYKADKSLGITWPDHYALPPYDNDGKTLKQRRVFMQDYMTVANFVLSRESLQKAYVTVPDLRSSQISLGLSVDLEWQTGLVFDVILGQ